LSLSDRVTLVDTAGRQDFWTLFARALEDHDVFTLASTTARDGDDEGGPALTLVYAQSSGMPVIATNFVGVERSVIDDETGALVQGERATDFAQRLLDLLNDPVRANSIGKRGAEFVGRAFSLEGQLRVLDDLYGRLT